MFVDRLIQGPSQLLLFQRISGINQLPGLRKVVGRKGSFEVAAKEMCLCPGGLGRGRQGLVLEGLVDHGQW